MQNDPFNYQNLSDKRVHYINIRHGMVVMAAKLAIRVTKRWKNSCKFPKRFQNLGKVLVYFLVTFGFFIFRDFWKVSRICLNMGKMCIFRDFWKVSRICLNMGEKVHFQRLLESYQNLFKYGGKSTFSETFGKFPEFV